MSGNDIVLAVSAKPERLPGGLGILSIERPLEPPDELHQTQLKDTLMRVLERMIFPERLAFGIEGEEWFQRTAISLAEDKDGHIVGVLIALILAAATGRMDLAVAGLFGAGKSRAAAVVVIGTLIINPQAKILVVCKENSAARSFLQLIESLEPPDTIRRLIGRVVSDEESGQHRLPLDIPSSRTQ